ncbi:pentapeptide repeat-containing protein [Serpentinicella alkaliphila]|nr:pentapeptide repeat-containing protein [Serpentinicella alkaliphila]QUH26201.1 pentapeptide repeat-containing protein [Serpentinicella alkaliphila]
MFEVFLKIRQLQELLWYLTEVLMHKSTSQIHIIACSLIREAEDVTYLDPHLLIEFDIVGLRSKVNDILVKASELIRAEVIDKIKIQTKHKKTMGKKIDFIGAKLRNSNFNGANLRGAFLIAADLRNTDFSYADLIGADFRDADVRGANLSKSIFLTQAQVNCSKGDKSTKIPELLIRPKHWNIG